MTNPLPYDPFMGIIGMKSTGEILPKVGMLLRFNYSNFSGYPKNGFTLYKIPYNLIWENVYTHYAPFWCYESCVFGKEIYYLDSLEIFSESTGTSASNKTGWVLNIWQKVLLDITSLSDVPVIKAFQAIFFGFGKQIKIQVFDDKDNNEEIILTLSKHEVRPFYFSVDKGRKITSICIESAGALMLEFMLLHKNWEYIDQKRDRYKLRDFNLPDSEEEMKNRVSWIADEKTEYKTFEWIADKIYSPVDSKAPIYQNYTQAVVSSDNSDVVIVNPHSLLNMISVFPEVAIASGLYYIDESTEPSDATNYGYLLCGHWFDEKNEISCDGFSWIATKKRRLSYDQIQLISPYYSDTDPFPHPLNFIGQAIDGQLNNIESTSEVFGKVGIGLSWDIIARQPGVNRLDAVRYQIGRKTLSTSEYESFVENGLDLSWLEQTDNGYQDVLSGQRVVNTQSITPEYQNIDFGDNGTGLNGVFVYGLRSFDIFGRDSEYIATQPIIATTTHIPTNPVDIKIGDTDDVGRFLNDNLILSFSWTREQYLKSPGVRSFRAYIDYRQPRIIEGVVNTLAQNLLTYEQQDIEVEVNEWYETVSLAGGIIETNLARYPIISILNNNSGILTIQISTKDVVNIGSESIDVLYVGDTCKIYPNWSNPNTWLINKTWPNNPINVPVEYVSEQASIDTVSIGSSSNLRIIEFTEIPFENIVRHPSYNFLSPSFIVASVYQNNQEYNVRPLEGEPKRYYLEIQQEDVLGDDNTPDSVIHHVPVTGTCEIFLRVTIEISNFNITNFVPDNNAPGNTENNKKFFAGVSAVDSQNGQDIEGPVSARATAVWINSTPPSVPSYIAPPSLESVSAERANINGFSTFRLNWDHDSFAYGYHVNRASEEMLIATDMENHSELSREDYKSMTLYELWERANDESNSFAFERLTKEPWVPPKVNSDNTVTYIDRTLPGHSQSRFFYRVKALSKTYAESVYSNVFQPVHCPISRPPEELKFVRANILKQGRNWYASLYWNHLNLDSLDYYVVYRTKNISVAENRDWHNYSFAEKILPSQSKRPLIVEYGHIEIPYIGIGLNVTVTGIYRYSEYESNFGLSSVTEIQVQSVGMQNHFQAISNSGRAEVSGLINNERVICFLNDGTNDISFYLLEGERYFEDVITTKGKYYYCLASVDYENNISKLSEPFEVNI